MALRRRNTELQERWDSCSDARGGGAHGVILRQPQARARRLQQAQADLNDSVADVAIHRRQRGMSEARLEAVSDTRARVPDESTS
jgi:hypothetical protein